MNRPQAHPSGTTNALRFITCGSVDDGKSTLIGRLLIDSRAVLQDQLAHVTHHASGEINATELARLTDGLQAEREQGITIDVAWRYFTSSQRKFIIGDAPGHEQYTRNMVTAASQADCAVVLVDATKLPWAAQPDAHPDAATHALLPQTRRHTLLAHLLRVPHIVFAINKLDAVTNAAAAFTHIRTALQTFCLHGGIAAHAMVPVSALMGWNVVDSHTGWAGYHGPSLLQVLEQLPAANDAHASHAANAGQPLAFPVQWVEKFASSADTSQARRVLWGRVGNGQATVGMSITAFPSGQTATIAQVLNHSRTPHTVPAPHSAGMVLDRELDISRGDWLLAAGLPQPQRDCTATIAWLDAEPLTPGRMYWALHGHRWVKAKVTRVLHALDIHTLEQTEAHQLGANAIGQVQLSLQAPLPLMPYAQNRMLGALILVDSASNATAAAVLVE